MDARRQLLLDIIARCGGLTAVARLLDVKKQAVWQWKERGVVPPRSAMRLVAIAHQHGIVATAGQLAGLDPMPDGTPPTGTDDHQTAGRRGKGRLRVVRQTPEAARAAAEAQYDATPRRLYPNPNKKRGNNWPMSPVELRPAA